MACVGRLKHLLIAKPVTWLFPDSLVGFREVPELLQKYSSSLCLDIGGGEGRQAAELRLLGREVIVLEPSHSLSRQLHKIYPDVPIVQACAEHLPFKPKTFQTTIFHAVLHHLEDPEIALKEASEVSRVTIALDYIQDSRSIVALLERLWLRHQDGGAHLTNVAQWRKMVSDLGGTFIVTVYGSRPRFSSRLSSSGTMANQIQAR